MAAEALAAITSRYEEALATGVIALEGFGLAHLALASSALRFAAVEKELGARVLPAAPRFEALVRRLAERPSIARHSPRRLCRASSSASWSSAEALHRSRASHG